MPVEAIDEVGGAVMAGDREELVGGPGAPGGNGIHAGDERDAEDMREAVAPLAQAGGGERDVLVVDDQGAARVELETPRGIAGRREDDGVGGGVRAEAGAEAAGGVEGRLVGREATGKAER